MARSDDEALYELLRRRGLTRRKVMQAGGSIISATLLASLCGYAVPGFAQESSGPSPRRGGVLRYANTDTLKPLKDPATVDSLGPSDAVRGVAEFLTRVDENNVPHPYLLESLDASSDLKTWTLKIRRGPMFNTPTPRPLDADDVIFNLKRWLDPEVGSSMNGLLVPYLDQSGIEKVDDLTVRLHLKTATNTLAYDFFHYAGAILPREFEGDFIKQPWGTGPFELVDYTPNQSFTFEARKDYWQQGADGKPLPYLDGVISIDVRSQAAAQVAGLVSGEFDLALGLDVAPYRTLQKRSEIVTKRVRSAGTMLFRTRVDVPPFDDPRVRIALKLCQNRNQIIELALGDTAFSGTDDMVAPEVDPAWFPLGPPAQDIARAKSLLGEAGFPNGFETEMHYPTAPEFQGTSTQVFARNAKEIGVDIKLVPMPADAYWGKWLEWTFGASYWSHRPIATMLMGLSLRAGAAWNETRYNDPTFEQLLNEATGTIDIEERRKVYSRLQPHLRENGPFAEPYFIYALSAQTKRIKGFAPTAFRYGEFTRAWLTPA